MFSLILALTSTASWLLFLIRIGFSLIEILLCVALFSLYVFIAQLLGLTYISSTNSSGARTHETFSINAEGVYVYIHSVGYMCTLYISSNRICDRRLLAVIIINQLRKWVGVKRNPYFCCCIVTVFYRVELIDQ